MILPLEVNGEPPKLSGRICEKLVAEEYWHKGALDIPANVVWLRFDGAWYRLYFDCGIVFWRTSEDGPKSYTMPEIDAEVRIANIGEALGLSGDVVLDYQARAIPGGSEVELRFRSGKRAVFQNVDDRTTYIG
jgi:hypothetical protein